MFFVRMKNQGGTVLVMMALVLIVLLILIGLALDAGNLYRARLALQNAADAAAFAGLNYAVHAGKFELDEELKKPIVQGGLNKTWSTSEQRDQIIEEYLEDKILTVAQAMMARSGYPDHGRYKVKLDGEFYSPPPISTRELVFTFNVEVERDVRLFLLDRIPGLGASEFLNLKAEAEVNRRKGIVMVFIDISDSMNCPATGDCSCMFGGGGVPWCTGKTKMDEAIDALKIFAKLFDPGKDLLFVTAFNSIGEVFDLEDMVSATTLFGGRSIDELTVADIEQFVDVATSYGHQPKGITNFCDAMMRGQQHLRSKNLYPNEDISYVFFSDGAPTAGRFLFSDPNTSATTPLEIWNPSGLGSYDYTVYTTKWTLDSDPTTQYLAPSALAQTDLIDADFDTVVPPPKPPATWATCSKNTDSGAVNPPLYSVGSPAELETAVEGVFDNCLNSLQAHLPMQAGSTYGNTYEHNGTKTFYDWQEMYYNCAIELADQFRNDNGRVYTIGLGNPSSPSGTDPYQDETDVASRHDYFNSRMANDGVKREIVKPPDFNYQGYEDFETSVGNGQQGIYRHLKENEAHKLKDVFLAIGKAILIKLTK